MKPKELIEQLRALDKEIARLSQEHADKYEEVATEKSKNKNLAMSKAYQYANNFIRDGIDQINEVHFLSTGEYI